MKGKIAASDAPGEPGLEHGRWWLRSTGWLQVIIVAAAVAAVGLFASGVLIPSSRPNTKIPPAARQVADRFAFDLFVLKSCNAALKLADSGERPEFFAFNCDDAQTSGWVLAAKHGVVEKHCNF